MALTLRAEYISSEEELEYPPSPYKNIGYVRTVRKLYWRPNHVTSRLSILDNMYWDKIASGKEKVAKTLVLRDTGMFSDRRPPASFQQEEMEHSDEN